MMDAAAQGVLHRLGLLIDLLEHEMRELPSLYVLGAELNIMNFRAYFGRLDGRDLKVVATKGNNLEVVQIDHPAGMGDDCAHITGQEVLVEPDADEQRAPSPGADYDIGKISMHNGNAVRAYHFLERAADGICQGAAVPSPAIFLR